MSRPVIDRQSHRRLRASLLALAAVLGLLAVCLLVFGTTARQSQLGAIVGLWAALIAAFEAPAFRRGPSEPAQVVDLSPLATKLEQHHELQLQATKDTIAAQSVDLRRAGELQMARESAARREADVNLQLAIRHEVERTVQDQFGILRQEVSSLRAEVVDKLGGQIKLERIETTRVIGSDLEALQNQIRRLAEDREQRDRTVDAQESRAVAAAPMIIEPVRVEPVVAQPVRAEPVRAEPVRAEPVRAEPVPTPVKPVESTDDGGWSGARSVRSAAAERQPHPPAAAAEPFGFGDSARRRDPFADLPRLTPVPPEVLEPMRSEPTPVEEISRAREPSRAQQPSGAQASSAQEPGMVSEEASGRRRAPQDDPDSPHYVGRRRPDREKAPEPSPDDSRADDGGPGSGRRRAPGHSSD